MQKESIEQSLLLWAIYKDQSMACSPNKEQRLKYNMSKIEKYLETYDVINIELHRVVNGTYYLKYLVVGEEFYIQIDLKTYRKKTIDKIEVIS